MKHFYKKISLLAFFIIGLLSTNYAQNVSFTYQLDDGAYCATTGMEIQFTNTSSIGSTTVEYEWHVNDESFSGNGGGFSRTFENSGSYHVVLQAFDSETDEFLGQHSKDFEVYPATSQNISFEVSTEFSDSEFGFVYKACLNEELIFFTESAYDEIQWDFGNGATLEHNYAKHRFSGEEGAIITVKLRLSVCGNVIEKTKRILITRHALPIAFIYTEGGARFCPNDEIKFEALTSATFFEWTFEDGATSDEREALYAYSTAGEYTVSLIVENACGKTTEVEKTIHIVDDMEAIANFDFWPQPVCPNSPVKFETWRPGTYRWDFGDGSTSNKTEPIAFYAREGDYEVTLNYLNGCGNTDQTSRMLEVVKDEAGMIDYVEIGSKSHHVGYFEGEYFIHICPEETVEFENYTWHPGQLHYKWEVNGELVSENRNMNYTFPEEVGEYVVVMTATDNCGASSDARITVEVGTNLTPDTELHSIPSSMCAGEFAFFWDEKSLETNYTYRIDYGDGTVDEGIAEETGGLIPVLAQHQYTTNGIYNYQFTATNMCGNSINKYGRIVVEDDVERNSFYYVTNSTIDDKGPNFLANIPDWSTESETTDHQFNVPFMFTSSGGETLKYYALFWYGEYNIYDNEDVLPDGIAMIETDQYDGTITAYVPQREDAETVSIAVAQFCDGNLNLEPSAIAQVEVSAGGGEHVLVEEGETTTISAYLSPTPQHGFCGDLENVWIRTDDASGETYKIEFYEEMVSDGEYEWPEQRYNIRGITNDEQILISRGTYSIGEGSIMFYEWDGNENGQCTVANEGSYAISLEAGELTFALTGGAVLSDLCSERKTALLGSPFTIKRENNPVCPGDNVQFKAVGGVSYSWDFGIDGATDVSDEQFPIFSYADVGEYVAVVTIINACGHKEIVETPVYVQEGNLPQANFNVNKRKAATGEELHFKHIGWVHQDIDNNQYEWDFGDGETSTERNPSHIYIEAKEYAVTLYVSNGCGEVVEDKIITIIDSGELCDAKFRARKTEDESGKEFQFSDFSKGNITEWYWYFDDGTESTEQDPVHTFAENGRYWVCLSTYDEENDCADEFCREIRVGTMNCQAEFDYYANVTTRLVQFVDESATGSTATDYFWTFGDGESSDNKQPHHRYDEAGTYEVCLHIYNSETECSSVDCQAVNVGESDCDIVSDFSSYVDENKLANFTNYTEGTVTGWYWDFGDQTTSTEREPQHQYTEDGYYLVVMAAHNDETNCGDYTAEYIRVGDMNCRADFRYSLDPENQMVTFENNSEGDLAHYYWIFDDGRHSAQENPEHHYAEAGLYYVTLIVSNSDGTCVDAVEKEVQIGTVNCNAFFTTYIDPATHTVHFENEAVGEMTEFYWEFGDGTYSEDRNPVHEYPHAGYYHVLLSTFNENPWCMDEHHAVIMVGEQGEDCEADFVFQIDPDTRTVDFFDESYGEIIAYAWDFNDGTTADVQNPPAHVYPEGRDLYHVCLTVGADNDGDGTVDIHNTRCKFVRLSDDPSTSCYAEFEFNVNGMTVACDDTSFGNLDTWEWDFGDGNTSTEQNPVYTYAEEGQYVVTLVVSNTETECESIIVKVISVGSGTTIAAGFNYRTNTSQKKGNGHPIDFFGSSGGGGSELSWDFGDGSKKTGNVNTTTLSPAYTYAETGEYNVCLTISDAITDQSDTYCKKLTITDGSAVNEPEAIDATLSVFPNPAKQVTTVSYTLEKSELIQISVYSVLGNKLFDLVNEIKPAGTHQLTYDVSGLRAGIYFLELKTTKGKITNKIVVN